MKTILKTYHKHSDVVAYHKYENKDLIKERTFDENGNPLTYKDSSGYSCKYTRDENGYEIAYETSDGFYHVKGKQVTKEKYEAFIDQLNSKNLDGKEVEIEGIKYKLTLIK